jgi:hypothetical protein
MTRLSALLAALTAACYLVLAWMLFFQVKPHAGGAMPLDLRVFGYSTDEAFGFLNALDPIGRAVYLNQVQWIDMVFPVLLTVALGRWTFLGSRNLHLWSRVVLLVPIAGYLVMDLCENALVHELLLAGSEGFIEATALLASRFTSTKFVLLFVSVGYLIVMRLRNAAAKRPLG